MEEVKKLAETAAPSAIKNIVYLVAIIWVLNLLLYIGLSFLVPVLLDLFAGVWVVTMILYLVVMYGLWKTKKWGLYLGYILSIVSIVSGVISLNIIQLILWAIVLYFLYKNKEVFS